ncbi:MAG: AraC family transcriptional regulator [Muribaculaceae bacterium]|nr:AraC family transcriptional regulator [Muribaculaceae bacterium]
MAYDSPDIRLSEGFSGQRSIVIPRIILDAASSDPILSGLHITAIGYYPKAYNHYRQRDIPIEDNILFYCASGKGWYRVRETTHEVKPNAFFILPAGVSHSYGALRDDPWTIYWIHFRGTLASCYSGSCQKPFCLKPTAESGIRAASDLFEEIYSVIDRNFTIEGLRYAAALLNHYIGLLMYMKDCGNTGESKGEQDIVDSAVRFLEENIERTVTLSMLSEYTGFSASYLSALFRQKTGHPPLAFFNILKIKQACRLLTESNMKVNSICHKVGIQDPFYFSRLFTKLMGISPSEYRKSTALP